MRTTLITGVMCGLTLLAGSLDAQQSAPKAAPKAPAAARPPARKPVSAAAANRARERELLGILDRARRALLAQDTTTLARIWASEYAFTAPSGATFGRPGRLTAVMESESTSDMPDLMPLVEWNTRFVGNLAIMRARRSRDGQTAGEARPGDVRTLVLWERRNGRWQIVAEQATRVLGPR